MYFICFILYCMNIYKSTSKTSSRSQWKTTSVEVKTEITITIKETIRIGTDQITGQIAETEDNTDKTEVGLDVNKILGEVILEESWEIQQRRI